jgi:CheY-like chemotaxis protein
MINTMHYKILIIEDNHMNMELFTDLLEATGFTLLCAYNAEEGIVLAVAELPDLILMDVALPGMDGLQATQRLQHDVRTKGIPIVALTAHAMRGDAAKAAVAGCIGYLSKPIDTRTFAKTVTLFVEAAAGRERAPIGEQL